MSKKRIFTVGFDLPGQEFEFIDFDSDQTLLDADIILYQPTLGECDFAYGEQYGGKSILEQHCSFAKQACVEYWRGEIVATVKAGKLVIVYLNKPEEYCRYTGEQRHSGTGRSRVTTNIVANISSYDAVPNIKRITPKSGRAIRLEKEGEYLAAYWMEFSLNSPYQVEIEGEFNKILLRSQAGDRTIGAAFHGKSGAIIYLPPLQYDEDKFTRAVSKGKDKGERFWTDEADKFGKRLVAALVGLDDRLRKTEQQTPPPSWSLGAEYRLTLEVELAGC